MRTLISASEWLWHYTATLYLPDDVRLTSVRNRGELAEGWYDPTTLEKAQASVASDNGALEQSQRSADSLQHLPEPEPSSDEDVVGPSLPGQEVTPRERKKAGPGIPNLQDLELRRGKKYIRRLPLWVLLTFVFHPELQKEDALAERQDLQHERRLDRLEQKQRLEELVPRGEAGSKDRLLEKKREKADANRAFASAKHEAGGMEEVPESDLLGAEGGGIEEFRKQRREMDRKKNEREVRREEVLRARMEEREERIREYRAKEEKTMSGLVALAKARFG